MERILAPFHGSRPPLGTGTESRYFRRAVHLHLEVTGQGSAATVVG
jgi:hypothetical protein